MLLVLVLAIGACTRETEEPEAPPQDTTAEVTPSPAPADETTPEPEPERGEARVITWGHWNRPNADPFYLDAVTGEPVMPPERLWAITQAWNAVYEELNVRIEFVQYPVDVREILLQSVLAGDPFADIVGLWGGSQGTILGQNVLRPIDQFLDIFHADPESAWMVSPPMFGGNFFVSDEMRSIATWPLVFNIDLIEAVDGLRDADGNTIFPTDLYLAGEWTWSRFEEYLEVLEAFYRDVPAPVRPELTIWPFQSDYRYTARKAFHSAGVAVFGPYGLQIDTPQAIQSVEFIQNLKDRNLMRSIISHYVVPGWLWTTNDFGRGEMVFSEIAPWQLGSASAQLAERGHSMGLVPFPRADFVSQEEARMESNPGNSFGILRGTDDETAALALDAIRVFTMNWWRYFGDVDNVLDFLGSAAEVNAVRDGIAIFHPVIGADLLQIYTNYSPITPNEFIYWAGIEHLVVEDVIGRSLYGYDGAARYATHVQEMVHQVHARLDIIGGAIGAGPPVNNRPPTFTSMRVTMPIGTDLETFDLSPFIQIEGLVDGPIPLNVGIYELEWRNVDPDVPGLVTGNDRLRLRAIDSDGNITGWHQQYVHVYDPNNTEPPVVTLHDELPTVELDSPAANINWNYFVYSAVDAHGADIRLWVEADLGFLDVTLPGEYPVILSFTDLAGNTTEVEIYVTVE